MWNLKNKINEQTKLKQTHRYRQRTDGSHRGRNLGEKDEWIKKYKLVITKQSWVCKIQHREYSQ